MIYKILKIEQTGADILFTMDFNHSFSFPIETFKKSDLDYAIKQYETHIQDEVSLVDKFNEIKNSYKIGVEINA